jgi:hypothetical protein
MQEKVKFVERKSSEAPFRVPPDKMSRDKRNVTRVRFLL